MNDMSVGVKIAANGRMVLPVAVRRALGLKGEGKVFVRVHDGSVTLDTIEDRVRWIQEQYRKHATSHSTVDDFLRERKEEAQRDDERMAQLGFE